MELINWVMAHATDMWLVLTSIVTTASIIVKLTPTPKDDTIVATIAAFIGKLALNKKNAA